MEGFTPYKSSCISLQVINYTCKKERVVLDIDLSVM